MMLAIDDISLAKGYLDNEDMERSQSDTPPSESKGGFKSVLGKDR